MLISSRSTQKRVDWSQSSQASNYGLKENKIAIERNLRVTLVRLLKKYVKLTEFSKPALSTTYKHFPALVILTVSEQIRTQ